MNLFTCIEEKNVYMFKECLKRPNVDPNQTNEKGESLLFFAVYKRCFKTVSILLSCENLDPNIGNEKSTKKWSWITPLHLAMTQHSHNIVSLLLNDNRVDPNIDISEDRGAKGYACIEDYMSQLLSIRKDFNPNKTDIFGKNVFHHAAQHGLTKPFFALIDSKRMDINKETCRGWTALHWAAEKGHCSMIYRLLNDKRLEKNKRCKNGRTPLFCATISGQTRSVCTFLHFNSVNVNILDKNGWSVLHWSAKDFRKDIFKYILQRNDILLSIGSKTKDGSRPFDFAKKYYQLTPFVQKWAKKRFEDICFSFKTLNLPLLQLLLIIKMDSIQYSYTKYLPSLYIQWEWGKKIRL